MKTRMIALGISATVSMACNPILLDPPSNGAQCVGSEQNASSSTSTVLAMQGSDLPSTLPTFAAASPDSVWFKAGTLVLSFTSEAVSCGDAFLSAEPRCPSGIPSWQFVLALAPGVPRTGLIDLRDPRVFSFEVSFDSDGHVDEQQSGPVSQGTLEILSNDPSALLIKLGSGVTNLQGTSLDGDYAAQRCSAAPAVALRAADVPTDPSGTSAGGGATPDPDTLFVFLGTGKETCQAPWSTVDCTNPSRLTFSLPASLQKPGVIPLDDPAINATFTVASPDASATCSASSGALAAGTVEILSGDASALSFRVHQSSMPGPQGGLFEFDGLYAAPICP